MQKIIRNIFIPNRNNNYQPYSLGFKALAGYLIILIILQLGINIFAAPKTTQKALAAVEINSSEIVSLTNIERTRRGLSALSVDGRLNNAAYNKCIDMFNNQYWDHISPSGTTPWYFISQAGYAYIYAGENLAKGFTSSSAIVNAWMNSPSHRDNILSSNFQNTGVAVMTGNLQGTRTTLCVQMFGTESSYTPAPAPVTPTPKSPAEPNQQSTQPTITPPPEKSAQQQKPPSPPEITNPKESQIINNNKPVISGKSAKDTKVNIYDNKNQIGYSNTEPEEIFIFKPTEPLKDGQHNITAEAFYKNGLKSNQSKPVNFIIDTTPPLIKENTLSADLFVENGAENYKVSVEVKDNPSDVTASVDHYSLILNRNKKNNDLFEGLLIPPAKTLTENPRKLTIIAYDKVSNQSSYLITIPNPEIVKEGSLQRLTSSIKSFLPRDFQNIARLLYFILALWIFILLLIDGVFVYVKDIVRVNSHSRAHLAIVFLMLVGILFANLGQII